MASEEKFTIESLIESNNILQDEVTRLRTSNRILRTVHSALRKANESLRRQVELAQFNDDTFKAFCAGEFDVPSTEQPEGGLPDGSAAVEPTV